MSDDVSVSWGFLGCRVLTLTEDLGFFRFLGVLGIVQVLALGLYGVIEAVRG